MNIYLYFLLYIMELFNVFLDLKYFKYINNNETITFNKKNLFKILLMTMLLLINNLFVSIKIKVLLGLSLTVFLNYLIFHSKLKKNIIYSIIYTIIGLFIELIISIPLIFFPFLTNINNSISFKMVLNLVYYIVLFLILNNNKLMSKLKKLNDFIDKNILYIITLLLFFINVIVLLKSTNTNNIYIFILSTICCIIIILYLIQIINEKKNVFLLNIKNNSLEESIKAYSKTIEDCKEMKHNIRNELLSVKSIVNKKDEGKIDAILKKYSTNYKWISTICNIPKGIQGLIYLKCYEAKKHKIKVEVVSKGNFEILEKDYFDVSTSIGILIDNAIEACLNSKNKIILINVYQTKKELTVEIINKFNNKINVDNLGKRNYSTKEIKSGLGINYIRNKNRNIKLTQFIINDLFISKISYLNRKLKN